jgi:superfamily II DNA/RNA helicase
MDSSMHFSDLGLAPALLRAVSDMGVAKPTPIQVQAIPAVLQGRDVWAAAPTGSGKTLAFALPLVQQRAARQGAVGYRRPVRTLVLVPTRELAVQAGEVITRLAYPLNLRVAVVHGGVSINPQMMALRGGADMVVATPGRLLDLVDHNAVKLGDVQHLVLDEADRLLDAGFAEEWQRVLALVPAQRQTLLFSATFAPEVQALVESVLNNPVRLSVQSDSSGALQATPEPVGPPEAAPDIRQRAIAVDTRQRAAVLRHLLKEHAWPQALVFVATRYACDHMVGKLQRGEVRAAALHGELTQGGRQQVLAAFKAGQVDVLVATDLASRGIDLLRLPVVINVDVARSATDHVHRIGRTGRAGASGEAITLVSADNRQHWQQLCERLALDVPLEVLPGFESTDPVPEPRALVAADGGGIKGKRPSKKDKLRAAQARSAGPSTS